MFYRSKRAKCLRNKPYVDERGDKKLPGKYLSRDQQCDNRISGSQGVNKSFSTKKKKN